MNGIGGLLGLTLRDARAGARAILALDLPMQARWMALVLMAVLSVLLTQIGLAVFPLPAATAWEAWMQDAVFAVPLQLAFIAALAAGIALVGRRFGGHATLADAVILVAWLEFVMLLLQVAQLVAVFVLPFLALIIGLGSVVAFFWLLTAFTAEANGFDRLALVFFGILGTMLVAALALVLLATLVGFDPVIPEP
ncbi:MAG: YIP1 family protein [Pseudomonadota bacterium]